MDQWAAIILPGRGYGPIGATIRIPGLVLESLGADVFVIEYPTAVSGQVPLAEILQTSREQIRSIVSATSPQRVTFVAKSLGCSVLLSQTPDVCGSALVEAIWLTPLFKGAAARTGAINLGWRSLLVAGDADPSHNREGFEMVRHELGAESLIVPGADHSLEVPGDPDATLATLRDLLDAVRHFAAP